MEITPETVNRIRLSDNDLKLFGNVLKKINLKELTNEEKDFYEILMARVNGRLNLKKQGKK